MTDWAQSELEDRICRALDGELSASERAELDRELLRDPEARRLMDHYRRIDRQAAAALRAAFGSDATSPLRAAGPRRPGQRAAKWRWGSIGVAAAALLVAVGIWAVVRARHLPGSDQGPARRESLAGAAKRAGPTHTGPALAAARGAAAGTRGKAASSPRHEAGADDVPLMYDTADPSPFFDTPRQGDRVIDRHFLGVFDETKRELYLIEVDRVRTRINTVSLDL
jgi:hypothetical protein